MSWSSLSHTPDFELSEDAPAYPEDLRGIVEEWHEGLTRIVVSKQLGRNKYSPFATVVCQDPKAATKKTHPTATPEEIAEYVMYMIQHEIDESDDPGKYKVGLFGPPGKGRFERSKHIDLTDPDGIPKSISMLKEGDLVEQQGQYIGELHGTIISLIEINQGTVKSVVQENREMMKIVSESVRKVGDVEAMRLNHELQLRMHADEAKQREAEREFEKQKYTELLNLVNETGAPEAIVKAIMRKVKKAERDKEESEKAKADGEKKSPWSSKQKPEGDEKKGKKKAAKKRKKSKKKGKRKPQNEEQEEKLDDVEDVSDDQGSVVEEPGAEESEEPQESEEDMEGRFFEEGMDKIESQPNGELLVAAEALKMSIDVKKQWSTIRETLSEEQYETLEEIFAAATGDEVEEGCIKLYELKGAKKLIKLQDHLDERQQQFVDILLDAALG
jgi:hypothetical protein